MVPRRFLYWGTFLGIFLIRGILRYWGFLYFRESNTQALRFLSTCGNVTSFQECPTLHMWFTSHFTTILLFSTESILFFCSSFLFFSKSVLVLILYIWRGPGFVPHLLVKPLSPTGPLYYVQFVYIFSLLQRSEEKEKIFNAFGNPLRLRTTPGPLPPPTFAAPDQLAF